MDSVSGPVLLVDDVNQSPAPTDGVRNVLNMNVVDYQVKEFNDAFKALTEAVNETLVNYKTMDSRVDSLRLSLSTIEKAIAKLGFVATSPRHRYNTRHRPFPSMASDIVKKLFTSPSSHSKILETEMIEPMVTPKSALKKRKGVKGGKSQISEDLGHETSPTDAIESPGGFLLPKIMKSDFPPTEGMFMLRAEVILVAYVFHPDLDPEEILVRVGNTNVKRADFKCLCPKNEVTEEMITLLTMKIAHGQHELEYPCVWALPPSFVKDVLRGLTFVELAKIYCRDWMPTFERLKYVYVPVCDEYRRWFLIVISLKDNIVYLLDTNLWIAETNERKELVASLCASISEVVRAQSYPPFLQQFARNLYSWEIELVGGIPNYPQSLDSAVWLLGWLQMKQDFHSRPSWNDNKEWIKMDTALYLLKGFYNPKLLQVTQQSESHWRRCMNGEL